MEVPETTPEDEHSPGFSELRKLIRIGDFEGVVRKATVVADQADNDREAGRALVLKMGSLFNLGRIAECPPVLDRAAGLLLRHGDPALLGHMYALAGIIAAPDSLERAVRHLVQGTRELDRMEEPDVNTCGAWHNLAVTYSYIGFNAEAMNLAERAYDTGQAVGLPTGDHALPEVAIRWALALDHRGDTDGCIQMLSDALEKWRSRADLSKLWPVEQNYCRYAVARLRVHGVDVQEHPEQLDGEDHGWESADLRLLTKSCNAIADGRPHDALAELDGRSVNAYTVGAAEIWRVRALAHAACGEHRSALKTDRTAMRAASDGAEQLRNQLVDGTRAQLDHEALRRTVEQYASEAMTDPLTGLPNRRHFDRRIAALTEQRTRVVIGVIDLDGFKAVNTVYGHLSGDLVLQRVAAILARTLRYGDFVARYGGDEFVAILPETEIAVAREIGMRMAHAVSSSDWDALVAGTPVSVTIGWAELTDPAQTSAALELADRMMLMEKQQESHGGIAQLGRVEQSA